MASSDSNLILGGWVLPLRLLPWSNGESFGGPMSSFSITDGLRSQSGRLVNLLVLILVGSSLFVSRADATPTLYGSIRSVLVTVDPATAVMTLVGPTEYADGSGDSLTNLAFDPVSGVLYGSIRSVLVTVDPVTAVMTLVGPTEYADGSGDSLTNLAFALPEIPTPAMLGLVLVFASRVRARLAKSNDA